MTFGTGAERGGPVRRSRTTPARRLWHDAGVSSPPPDRLLITVAPTGAETAKADCPQLPTTLEELVATAVECEAAGAGMIHVHIRDDEHEPTLDLGRLTATVQALHEATSLVVQLSTGGSVHDPLDQRLKVLDAGPDSCSLTMGTTNFGDDVFSNPWPFVQELYQLAQERGVVPEFELFDLGQVWALERLLGKYGLPCGRPRARRLRHGRARRDARHRRGAGRRGGRAPGRGDLVVGHRHRPLDAAGDARVAGPGRTPAGGHGGRADDLARRTRRVQRPARRPRRRGGRRRAAGADDDGRDPRAAGARVAEPGRSSSR